jgi:predicted GTPase
MDEATLTQVLVPVVFRLAEIKATQEIILKVQAQFVAAQTSQPWEPLFEDLRAQAREAAVKYREQILNEVLVQIQQKKPFQKN